MAPSDGNFASGGEENVKREGPASESGVESTGRSLFQQYAEAGFGDQIVPIIPPPRRETQPKQ